MKLPPRTLFKLAGAALGLLLAVGFAAPYVNTSNYGERLRHSLSRALGRPVEFRGKVRFSLFNGGFTVDDVVIHEDPSIGLEPVAYMESMSVRPGIWALLGGRFMIDSIRLDGASINLTKSGPASEWGHWNFSSFVDRSVLSRMPAVHVRDGRIHFKFGDDKSVFYLTETDLDITPPGSARGGWAIDCSAKAARTDRPATGLGEFRLTGHWYASPEHVDLNLELARSGLGEITALLRGQSGGVHGTVSSRLHLAGPIHQIGIVGRIDIEDVHRWDLLPQHGQTWPLAVRGQLDLVAQQLELQSASAGNAALPLWVRFRASDYLSQPKWAVALNWNRFPVGPLMDLAQHMGAQFPPGLKLGGALDGALGYSGQGSLQGELAFHDIALNMSDSPPLRFEEAHVVLDRSHVRLDPALVRSGEQDQARIEADYALDQGSLDLGISTEALKVESLRAQVSLAAVPWLEQVRAGTWSGQLHYRFEPAKAVWTGDLQVKGAQIPVPGLADAVELTSAHAQIDGARVAVDHIRGRAGKLDFTGEYTYQPGAPRPHRLRLRAATWDAADVEAEWMPTLHRASSLFARALGRAPMPDWLKTRAAEITVQLDGLTVAGTRLENLRTHVLWDAARIDLENLQARVEGGSLTGKLAINLRGTHPVYRLSGQVKGLNWQSGKLEAEGAVSASGTGRQLLASLTSEGTFTGTGLDFGQAAACRSASGTYSLAWAQGIPRFKLTGVSFRTEDETYTGRGATQDDGKLLLLLTDGTRELRVTGSPAKLRVEEPLR